MASAPSVGFNTIARSLNKYDRHNKAMWQNNDYLMWEIISLNVFKSHPYYALKPPQMLGGDNVMHYSILFQPFVTEFKNVICRR